MILDNKHIQGIFCYSSIAEYEKGDFIVDGDCIYICKCQNPNTDNNTVLGISPSTDSQNFSIYPGEMISTADEYFDYLKNKDSMSEDKYISAMTLNSILQNYYFGYGESGVITNDVSNYLNTSKSLHSSVKVLDSIMRQPDLNNGVMTISDDFKELNTILLRKMDIESKNSKHGTVILRQYTYINNSDNNGLDDYGKSYDIRYRVQELIDIIDNQIYIRATKGICYSGQSWVYENKITQWKCTVENSKLLSQINDIIKNHVSTLESKSNEEINTKFYYTLLDNFIEGTNEVTLISSNSGDSGVRLPIILNDNMESFSITVDLKFLAKEGSTVYKANSIVLDLKDIYKNSSETYYLDDKNSIVASYSSSGNKISLEVSTGGNIKSIYYRNYEQ